MSNLNTIELKPGNLVIYEYKDSLVLTKVGVSIAYDGRLKADDIEIISGTGPLMYYWPIGEVLSDVDKEINIKEIFENKQECYDKYPEFAL